LRRRGLRAKRPQEDVAAGRVVAASAATPAALHGAKLMAQIFRPRSILVLKLGTLGLVAVLVTLILVWRNSIADAPPIDSPVAQTPPFSHKHHVSDVGLDCRFCHVSVETSAFAGIPPTSTCMNCHSQLFKGQGMLAPVYESFGNDDKPLRWKRIHHLPDFVYFNHSIHIAKGVGCSTCHGRIDRMPLTLRTQSLQMDWCLGCHRAPEKYVRPHNEIFDMAWQPPPDQIERGRELLAANHVNVRRLTDCSNCHR
jgi:hypothetical protein